jgi:ATP-binding cassette subfamily F protein uup
VCSTILGLDGLGRIERFADYTQWEEWRAQQTKRENSEPASRPTTPAAPTPSKKKLSYLEAREYDSLESRIAVAEQDLNAKVAAMEDPAIASDAVRLQLAIAAVDEAREAVDRLYSRWAELEEKKSV